MNVDSKLVEQVENAIQQMCYNVPNSYRSVMSALTLKPSLSFCRSRAELLRGANPPAFKRQ